MDDRANQPAPDNASADGVDAARASRESEPLPSGPARQAAINAEATASMHTGGSSVRRQSVARSGGSSRTRAFAATSTDDAAVSANAANLTGGSTSRRAIHPVGRIDNQPTVISKQPPASMTPPLAQLPPVEMGRVLLGQTLGHYELLEFVGGGGMGAVFRALDTMLNRIVAVKVLSHDQSDDEETLRRFKNEAQSAARLDHENIGRVHYVGEDGGWHYIVFEFIDGINLRDLVDRDGPLAVTDAVRFMLQLGDALAHAARRDVVHRDIKPSNVLITPEGKAKLVDMGLARLHQVEHANNDLTASGVTLGTFDYISPEQARDPRSADVRSDLYSLGCTFYFMITGRPPFPEGTVLQKLLAHQGDDPPDPRQFCAELPDDVYRILKRMLAKSPVDRYQQPGELVIELTAAAVRLGLQPASPGSMVWLPSSAPAPARWQHVLPWLVPLLSLVLIVLVLNAIWTPSESTAPTLFVKSRSRENALPGKSVVAAEAPRSATKNGTELPSANSSTSTDRRVRKSSDANGIQSGEKPLNLMPWIESAVVVPKEMASSVWQSLHSDDFSGRLAAARQSIRLPFDINLRSSSNTDTASNGSSAELLPAAGIRIVAGKNAAAGQYDSLAAAIREAKSGDVIEVRTDGPLVEDPLDITNIKLTIRGQHGRTPVIRFEPGDEDLLTERRTMIDVDGGRLTLQNLHLDFAVPSEPSERWSLVELSHAEGLYFQQCTVTVRNTSEGFDRPTAGIVNVRAGLADGAGMMKDTMPRPIEIEARASVFRGEAAFLQFADARPVELRAENVLMALGERLIDGDVGLMSGRAIFESKVELRHCTILAQAGLVRLANESGASSVMPLLLECADSILVGGMGAAMVEQVANEPYETVRRQVSWSGDHTLYDGFSTLWRIQGSGAPQEYSFRKWQEFWGASEIQTIADSAGFLTPPLLTGRPLHTLRASDFRLRASASRAAGYAEGDDAGVVLEELPVLP